MSRLQENTFVSQKIVLIPPKQSFPLGSYHYFPDRRKLPISSEKCFLKIYYPLPLTLTHPHPVKRGED